MKLSRKNFQNQNGSTFFQYFSSFTAMLAIVSSGLHYGWPSPSLPKLQSGELGINITENEGFWLATTPLLGAFLGSSTAPLLVENLGRRTAILLSSLPYLISWIIIVISNKLPLLYTARFIAGISDGWAFTSVPMYIGEISQSKIRGFLGSGVSVSFIIGILLINVIGSYLSIKMTAIVGCMLPIIVLVTFVWMPESPYFLIMKNRQEEAKRSLQTFIGPKLVDNELFRISQAVTEDLSLPKNNPLDIFKLKRNLKPFLVMALIRGAQQLSGSSAIVFYAQTIFNEAGSDLSADVASIIYFSIQVLFTIIAARLVDKLGRRPLLLFSVIGAFLSLLVEGIYFYIKSLDNVDVSEFTLVPVVSLIMYVICFSIGLQNIPILILSEIFNQNIKAVALCFADIYFSLLAILTSKFFQLTRDNIGIYFPFFCFSSFCAVAAILIYFVMPETTGKTLEEIQDYFKRTDNKKKEKVVNDVIIRYTSNEMT